jgi:hypothetical protein
MKLDPDTFINLVGMVLTIAILFTLVVLLTGCMSNPSRPLPVDTYPGVVLLQKKF